MCTVTPCPRQLLLWFRVQLESDLRDSHPVGSHRIRLAGEANAAVTLFVIAFVIVSLLYMVEREKSRAPEKKPAGVCRTPATAHILTTESQIPSGKESVMKIVLLRSPRLLAPLLARLFGLPRRQ